MRLVRRSAGATDIAHLTTVHPANDNRIFNKECTALAQMGLNVTLIAVAKADASINGVSIKALRRRPGRFVRMLLGPIDAWRALRVVRPALIHVHDPELIPLAIVWRIIYRRPAVYDAHEDFAGQIVGKKYIPPHLRALVGKLARLLQVLADKLLDGVVVAEPALLPRFTNKNVVAVQNYPWLREYPAPKPPPPSDPGKLVYVGAVTTARGIREMVAATRAIDNVTLTLAGNLGGAEARMEVDSAGSRVKYLGPIPPSSVPELLAASSVGLSLLHPLPNYRVTQSTKLFEYMAAGRPFVASNFPFWIEVFGEWNCGLFVDPTDVEAIAQAIASLANDPAMAGEMGRNGRRALEEHFTFEGESEVLFRLTAKLLGLP